MEKAPPLGGGGGEVNPDSAYTLLYNKETLRIESDYALSSLRAPNVRSNTSIIQPKDIRTSRKTLNRVGINNQYSIARVIISKKVNVPSVEV